MGSGSARSPRESFRDFDALAVAVVFRVYASVTRSAVAVITAKTTQRLFHSAYFRVHEFVAAELVRTVLVKRARVSESTGASAYSCGSAFSVNHRTPTIHTVTNAIGRCGEALAVGSASNTDPIF